MRQLKDISQSRKGKHLSWEERIQIETLQRTGHSSACIAEQLERSVRTIRREITKGWVLHRTGKHIVQERYSAERGQATYEKRMSARVQRKLIDQRLATYLYDRIINHKESPEVVAAKMKKEGAEYMVCAKTIYNLIDRDLVPGVSNASLWEKRKRAKGRRHLCRQRKRAVEPGHSIADRPKTIEQRQEAGHWEIDLIVGGQGKGTAVLLTLTERKTRKQLMRKLKNRTQRSVIRAINGIERQMGAGAFRTVFKSITADNGSEFLDREALERSVFGGSRTHIYYAHPYSSWERGSNERANRIIRRFIPKGCDISAYTRGQIQAIEDWINNYPRKILNFETAEERFKQELVA